MILTTQQPIIITTSVVGIETTLLSSETSDRTFEQHGIATAEALRAGASIIHLQIPLHPGFPTQYGKRFAATMSAMTKYCGALRPIVQISTNRSLHPEIERRKTSLSELHGYYEMASLYLGSMNVDDEVFFNPEPSICNLAGLMMSLRIVPELLIYDLGHMWTAERLLQAGLLAHPAAYTFVMGVKGGMKYSKELLQLLVSQVLESDLWSIADVGEHESRAIEAAIAMGGHVRLGFEGMGGLQKRLPANTLVQKVKSVVEMAARAGRSIASPDEARAMLGLEH